MTGRLFSKIHFKVMHLRETLKVFVFLFEEAF